MTERRLAALLRRIVREELDRARHLDAGHFVYVFRCPTCCLVKIGFSTDLGSRVAAVEADHARRQGCRGVLVVIGAVPGDRTLERRLHEEFAAERVEWEWFSLESDQISDLALRCARDGWTGLPP